MSQLNSILGASIQSPAAQRQQDLGKAEQMRHRQDQRKNTAASSEEEVGESVASPDQLESAAGNTHGRKQRKGTYSRKQNQEEPETPADNDSLDLTA